jgi:hypothetical protein
MDSSVATPASGNQTMRNTTAIYPLEGNKSLVEQRLASLRFELTHPLEEKVI